MQGQERLSQVGDRLAHDLLCPGHARAPGRGLDQLLVRREQALQRVVVDQLGDPAPRAVFRVHHLGDELPAARQLRLGRREPLPQLRDLSAEVVLAHSRSPRRIPSATAAARSDTPSFS